MNSMNRTLRRYSFPVSLVLGGGLAAAAGTQLASYSVPSGLSFGCALCICSTFTSFLQTVAEALTTTTHRCRKEGCDFAVRLGAQAAENRRWQEIAATHPHRH
ncbi:hypothetical protein [Streptomyces niger]|uniref:hypothetical protein n=1 Tax=Streptomyces niger TaxID=66373 RepID=UPI000699F9E4|nr:hypothetical protein [Streptomyces niger]